MSKMIMIHSMRVRNGIALESCPELRLLGLIMSVLGGGHHVGRGRPA